MMMMICCRSWSDEEGSYLNEREKQTQIGAMAGI